MAATLPGFSSLGNGIWVSEPDHGSASRNPPVSKTEVGLIILCAWMGAAPRHIAKYTTQHRLLFPSATILVLQSEPLDVTWRSNETRARRLTAARAVVRAFNERQTQSDHRQKVLLHAFSNGGAQCACQLATQLRAETGQTMQLNAMVLDSSPGGATLSRAVDAFAASLPNSGAMRWLGVVLLYVFFALWIALVRIMGSENLIDTLRRQLDDGELFDLTSPRCYFYSKADKLVDWRDVEAHANSAREKGFVVRRECFEGSEHVAHAMLEKDRYWTIVKELCQSA